ncbi:MAG TPA: hypothetical protein VNM50_07520 [Chloroflexota bacterium]|nr:hypothetical protein [Chloroflexota bacterium]
MRSALKATGDAEAYFATVPDAAAVRRWYLEIGMAAAMRFERAPGEP